MDKKKLDKWTELLLDTGKRNNLISFKDTKASTAEVLYPEANVLFDKMDARVCLELFDPKIPEQKNENPYQADPAETEQSKSDFLEINKKKLKRQTQILLYNSAKNPIAAIKNIKKKAQEYIEETGVNVAYMAFGFIHWKESEHSNFVFHAPVLLIPFQLSQASPLEPYTLQATEDDFIVNPTFSFKLEMEYGIKLPEYTENGLSAYLQKVKELVSRLHWTVSPECKIGLFSFLKVNMYRDLKDHADVILTNQNIRSLLGEPGTTSGVIPETSMSRTINPLIDLHSVVDADSSQIEAIEMAKSGQSFVLQGPPGTGKSQTITNIIAECLSDGKKVLFVSEKLAALNVVYDKLKQAGLSEFCLQLHSHKANKKDIIDDLCHTLHAGKSAISSRAETEIAMKEKAQAQLDRYVSALHATRQIIKKSLYQLYEAHAKFREIPEIGQSIPDLDSKGEDYLADTTALLEQYVQYIPSIGYDYRKNPWYGYIHQDLSYQTKTELKNNLTATLKMFQALLPIQQEIAQRYQVTCSSLEDIRNWEKFFRITSSSQLFTTALLNQDQFGVAYNSLHKLKTKSEKVLRQQEKIDEEFDSEIYEIDGVSCHKKLTKLFGSFFSRLFNPEYKNIMRNLRLSKKDGQKPSYQEAIDITAQLAAFMAAEEEYAELEEPVKKWFGPAYKGIRTNWDQVFDEMEQMKQILEKITVPASIEHLGSLRAERAYFADLSAKIQTIEQQCPQTVILQTSGYFDHTILDISLSPFIMVITRLSSCLEELDVLDNWCYFRNLICKLHDMQALDFINTAISQNLEPQYYVNSFKKQFYSQWIDAILASAKDLTHFTRIPHDNAIRIFTEKDIEQFEINKAKIRASLSSKRPSLDVITPGSPLAILLREGEKKRKQKSIRALFAETGELVQRIKPCFLMSPLSVSTFLAPESIHFDVVVFDEASQIFPQDAVGAIYRADQLIVVGDSKQMPPSNFFTATVEANDNDEDSEDITDFESILDLCATSMRQLRLRWHYRSRCEQLIAFSNQHFYDNDLVTFPSSQEHAEGVGVSYHYADGLFDRKSHTNRKEAELVVDLIYQNIEKYPDRSLGVMAFSVAQQELIDNLLSKRRQTTPEKEFFFTNDAKEPFFIKNLETVQGDERDTIIFSVAYGKDEQGRLLHNFGPLNRVGGERRLNVAITRAKYQVQLVSSMHHTDIDLKRTASEGARLLRAYLDYAEHGTMALERTITVRQFEQFDSDFEAEIYDFLKSRGFSVDTQVGCSGFRIDLGLKEQNSSNYVLAIECDGATYHSSRNARDRDRLRQQVLERMGWKFYRIWSTDWFRNKTTEQKNLLEAAVEALRSAKSISYNPERDQETEIFEEEIVKEESLFPPYKTADINQLSIQYLPQNFIGFIKAILKTEAPLSEDLLLKRITWYFGRNKVTSIVKNNFEEKMIHCEQHGIIRKNHFLYLKDQNEFQCHKPGDLERTIDQIAPEELAAGMYEILKQNITVDKEALFRSLAAQCGITRMGKNIEENMESALRLLSDKADITENKISLL